MPTGFARWHIRLLAPLALAAGAALAVALLGQGSAEAGAAGKQQRVIAAAVSNGFRVKLTATREAEPGNKPDTATVRIAAFRRSGGSWNRLGRALTVGQRSGWFWNVVTRPYGVRRLTLARPGGRHPDRIALRLLISPSIGPSATYRFVVDRGRLVQVDV
ncbi:MAG: hypothetical protein ACRDY6_13825 [Acidimicrobiia bacterium]